MAGGSRDRRLPFRLAALAVLAAVAPAARAGDLSLRYAPDYRFSVSRTDRVDGSSEESQAQGLGQRVWLGLDQPLTPTLHWNASGTGEWSQTWGQGEDASPVSTDSYRWTLGTRLELRAQPINAGLSYGRRDALSEATALGVTRSVRAPILDTYSGWLLWAAADLPRLALNVSRVDQHDPGRDTEDLVTTAASLALDYNAIEDWQLRYAYQVARPVNRIAETTTLVQGHAARASWGRTYLGGRVSTAASYGAGYSRADAEVGARGGVRETRRPPSSGLSRVEAFPETTARVTLERAPLLADGDTATPTELDLGFARSAARDLAPRNLGAEFPDDRLEVNRIRVWVDRALPAQVWGAFTWEAWRSDDNLEWTPIPSGAVSFGLFENRFEIPIAPTRTRYVKVVARPLATTVTTDPLYAAILVTEIEMFLVESLPPGRSSTDAVSGDASASLRWLLLREPSLAYDAAAVVSHRDEPDFGLRSSLQQSVGFARQLGERTRLAARASRTDALDEEQQHAWSNQWGASLESSPLPVLTWNLNYSGSYIDAEGGATLANGAAAAVRADLYPGLGTRGSIDYRHALAGTGRVSRTTSAAVSADVVPHRALSANGSFSWRYSQQEGGGLADRSDRGGRVDGAISFNPFPALYLSASGGRDVLIPDPVTSTALSAGLSLFRGGALSLRMSVGQTTTGGAAGQVRSRNASAGLSLSMGAGKSFDVSYGYVHGRTPVEVQQGHSVLAGLRLTLL